MKRLTDAQASAMRSLAKGGGYTRLSNSMFRTYTALHERGLVIVTIQSPVNGYVMMTDVGKELYPIPNLDNSDDR